MLPFHAPQTCIVRCFVLHSPRVDASLNVELCGQPYASITFIRDMYLHIQSAYMIGCLSRSALARSLPYGLCPVDHGRVVKYDRVMRGIVSSTSPDEDEVLL